MLADDSRHVVSRHVVSQSGQYILLDRQNIVGILGEEDFAAAIRCDQTRCLLQYGKRLPAQKLCHGRVNKVGTSLVVTINLTNVSSGRIEAFQTERVIGGVENALDIIEPMTCELLLRSLSSGP